MPRFPIRHRRLATIIRLIIAITTVGAVAAAPAGAVAEEPAAALTASTQLRADFNEDGWTDLAIGVPQEEVNGVLSAGAVHVLYGSPAGVGPSSNVQYFRQGSGGVPDAPNGGENFGFSLAAGDFNGDGAGDLAVGATFEDTIGVFNSGLVHVFYGGAAGLSRTGSHLFRQGSGGVAGTPNEHDMFGFALKAGDFNGDGRSDLAIGVPGQDVSGASEAGVVQVLNGTASGLSGQGSKLFSRGDGGLLGVPAHNDWLAEELATEDFNGDGRADLAIGMPRWGTAGTAVPEDSGLVIVIFGGAGGLTASGARFLSQTDYGGWPEIGENFGAALAAGDFNGDQWNDLVVGVPSQDFGSVQSAGQVDVFYGGPAGLGESGSNTIRQGEGGVLDQPEVADLLGAALATGDFNNDGRSDLAIGVPEEDAGGAVMTLYGRPGGIGSAVGGRIFRQGVDGMLETQELGDLFGGTLAAGDFDGDGRVDLAIGTPNEGAGALVNGVVHVMYSGTGGVHPSGNQLFRQGVGGISGTPTNGERFGTSLAA